MDDSKINFLYKILPTSHELPPSPEIPLQLTPLDKKDGFIHLSNSIQAKQTAARFFGDEDEIIILKIPYNQSGIKENVKWEVPPGILGEHFPHLYGDLLAKHVNIVKIKKNLKVGNERFEWPEGWLEM